MVAHFSSCFTIVENGCKWKALPKKFGNWHTIYMRFNKWAKKGTIQRIFEELQKQNIIKNQGEILCLDNTGIKVYPDTSWARKTSYEQSIGHSKGGWQIVKLSATPQQEYESQAIF